jgi:hypothetical protein
MAVRIVALLVLLASLTPTAGTFGAKPPEFRGLSFGAPLASIPDMQPAETIGPVTFARRASEKPLLGEECATDVRYAFSREGLFAVRIALSGCEGLGDLIRAYEAKYGRPVREGAPGFIRLVWRQPTLAVSLSHFARDGRTEVDYVYLPDLTHDEREVWQSAEDIRRDGPIGFRGLRFGREAADIPNLAPAYREGAAVYYRRRGDRLELGETKLTDVLYGFWNGRFFAAVMRAENAEDFEALRRAYMAKYGPPRTIPSTLEEELVWSWPKAQIALSRDADEGGLVIRYADAGLLAEVAAAESAAGAPPTLSGGLRIFSRTEPPRSFRGATFGASARALPAGEYLYGHRGRKYYRRADERLNLGDIPLTSVLYAYDEDRLASVTLVVTPSGDAPEKDYDRVLAAYASKYGQPATRQGDDGGVLHLWSWPGVSIALSRPKVGPMEVHYVDASLLRRREARIAAKALGGLDRKVFDAPDASGPRIERSTGQE